MIHFTLSVVVGMKEMENDTLAVRSRQLGDLGSFDIKALLQELRRCSQEAEEMTMQVQLDKAEGFPINEPTTLAILTFKSLGPNKSSFQFDFTYGTKPKFLSGMIKGSFVGLLEDYMIALEHYIVTGEKVNASIGNFKEVKKAYKQRHAKDANDNLAIN